MLQLYFLRPLLPPIRSVQEHVVVESHPDDQLPDLRLLAPFPELIRYCEKQDLSSMSKKDHSHTPWLVLLYHALEQWKKTHEGQPPKNYKEKTLFKQVCVNCFRLKKSFRF